MTSAAVSSSATSIRTATAGAASTVRVGALKRVAVLVTLIVTPLACGESSSTSSSTAKIGTSPGEVFQSTVVKVTAVVAAPPVNAVWPSAIAKLTVTDASGRFGSETVRVSDVAACASSTSSEPSFVATLTMGSSSSVICAVTPAVVMPW